MKLNRTTLSIGATGLSVATLGGVALAAGNGETPKAIEAKPIVIADVRTEHRFVHVKKQLPAPPRRASSSTSVRSSGGAAGASYASYDPGSASTSGSNHTQASSPASVPAPVVHTHSSGGGSWRGDEDSGSESESHDRHEEGDSGEHENDD